jgi:hypothetical protein
MRFSGYSCVLVAILTLSGGVVVASVRHLIRSANPATKVTTAVAAGRRATSLVQPLRFVPNRGQLAAGVKFFARTSSYGLFLTDGQLFLEVPEGHASSAIRDASRQAGATNSAQSKVTNARRHSTFIRLRLAKGSPRDEIGADELPGRLNYLLGNDPARWHRDIATYARVIDRAAWPGIDVVWYGNSRQLECDFVVAPGANANAIGLDFTGSARLRVDGDGALTVVIGNAELRLLKPVVYQQVGSLRLPVDGAYAIASIGGVQRVKFRLARYDHSRSLVIDPVVTLSYSTYLGGSGGRVAYAGPPGSLPDYYDGENGFGVAVDSSGSAYVVGETFSSDFPTANAFQGELDAPESNGEIIDESTNFDAFVTKFSPDGGSLVYSTYLGGSAVDEAFAVAVDSSGSAYVVGETFSSDFPIANAFKSTLTGSEDGFVTKLSPDGSSLVYSTYIGGSDGIQVANGDYIRAIAIDSSGNAYVTGTTFARSDFAVSSNAYQKTLKGISNAFAIKLSGDGATELYSTYLGGSNLDQSNAIAVDAMGDAYIAGATQSTDFPTLNAVQSNLNGFSNAFVAELNPAGTGLVYSTYLGGSGTNNYQGDYAYAIAVDSTGSAYLTGLTLSSDFPTTLNAFQTTLKSQYGNAFVSKLNPGGGSLNYSTYLGGSGTSTIFDRGDVGFGIAVDTSGNAYVAGQAFSEDFPTANAFQDSLMSQNGNAFVTAINAAGTGLVYSTLLGGTGTTTPPSDEPLVNDGDAGYAIALDPSANAFVTGYTYSKDFPVASPYAGELKGYVNAFMTKLTFTSPTPTATPTATATPDGARIATARVVTLKAVGIGTGQSSTKTFNIKNSSAGGNLIGSVTIYPPSPSFDLAPNAFSIPPRGVQRETVTLQPTGTMNSATAIITSNDSRHEVLIVRLKGNGLTGRLSVPSIFSFDGIVGQQTEADLQIKNVGQGVLSGSWASISTTPYTVMGAGFGPLPPGGEQSVKIEFLPITKGPGPKVPLTITADEPSSGKMTTILRGIGKLNQDSNLPR